MKKNNFNLIASGKIGKSEYFYQIGEINKHWTIRITKGKEMIRMFEYNELVTNSFTPPTPKSLISWLSSQIKLNRLELPVGQLQESVQIVYSEAVQKTFMVRDKSS